MARLLLNFRWDPVGIKKTGIRFAPRILIDDWPIEHNCLFFLIKHHHWQPPPQVSIGLTELSAYLYVNIFVTGCIRRDTKI